MRSIADQSVRGGDAVLCQITLTSYYIKLTIVLHVCLIAGSVRENCHELGVMKAILQGGLKTVR